MLAALTSPPSKLSVFAAPISVAAAEASPASASAASLWGMVTLAPTNPSAASARVSSVKSAAGISIAS